MTRTAQRRRNRGSRQPQAPTLLELAKAAIPQLENGIICYNTPEGLAASTRLLQAVEAETDRRGLAAASRSYRGSFQMNYQQLFPDLARSYRCDILGAAQRGAASIPLNGTMYELKETTVMAGKGLVMAWQELIASLVAGDDVGCCLEDLDDAWACFEAAYVSDLSTIENRIRAFVNQLAMAFARWESSKTSTELWARLNRLNAVANVTGKGRSDMDGAVLKQAQVLLQRHDWGCDMGPSGALVPLAQYVKSSFDNMKRYFTNLKDNVQHVDAILSNNKGMVEHLAAWERAWGLGKDYLCDKRDGDLLGADLAFLSEVTKRYPELEEWIQASAVEGLLTVPRLLVARGLHSTTSVVHRFAPKFCDEFQTLRDAAECSQDDLVAAIIDAGVRDDVGEGVVRQLEGLSVQVQRQNPEAWNNYLQTLLQCVSGQWAAAVTVTGV